jgi:hypothetical protein
MGHPLQAGPVTLPDNHHSAILELFAFEEMTTLSDEARILSLPALGNRSLAAGSWIDIPGKASSVFHLLAAHPRMLGTARFMINGDVRPALQRIWVGHSDDTTPPNEPIIAAPPPGQVTAIICLAGEARTAIGPLQSGSVLWLIGNDSLALEPTAAPLMLCVVSYGTDESRVGDHGSATAQIADDSLWPSAYVMAG